MRLESSERLAILNETWYKGPVYIRMDFLGISIFALRVTKSARREKEG
jgi:hypothetical protein